ncbi:MAG: beta-phosphoglucomutase [Lachnospiraceae bacterium]
MNYKGILFDLDGVLCHTDRYHYQAWKALADRLGMPFDKTINQRLRGVSRRDCLEIILEQYPGTLSEDEKQKYLTQKNQDYQELLGNMSPADLDEAVLTTLHELRVRGHLLAVGSSSKNAKLILNKLGLGDFFDTVSDGNNITKSKPDPEVFLKASSYLGLAPKDCLVVEDAVAGLEAAKAAGMDAAAIADAAFSPLAAYSLTCFSDLLRIS